MSNHQTSLSKSVLLIEDDDDHVLILSLLLEQSGYEVKSTSDAESALTLLDKINVDCIVCDAMLPGVHGDELIKKIRASEKYSATPIVLLTAARADLESTVDAPDGPDIFCLKSDARKNLVSQLDLLVSQGR